MPDVTIDLDIDAAGARAGGRTAEGALRGVGQEVSKTEGLLNRAKGAVLGFLAAFSIQALRTIARGIFDLGAAAGETADAFRRTFEEGAPALDAFLRRWANTAGLTLTAARELSLGLGGMARGLGLTGQAAAAFSERVMSLAGDIASLRNLPVAEVLQSIQSGLAGETEPMRRFGVFLNEAAIQAEVLRTRAAGVTGEVTEQEKALARLNLMYAATTSAAGNLAQTADSDANTLKRVTAELNEMREAAAVRLLPALGALLRAFDDLQPRLREMARDGEGGQRALADIARSSVGLVRVLSAGQGLMGRLGVVNLLFRAFNDQLRAVAWGLGLLLRAGLGVAALFVGMAAAAARLVSMTPGLERAGRAYEWLAERFNWLTRAASGAREKLEEGATTGAKLEGKLQEVDAALEEVTVTADRAASVSAAFTGVVERLTGELDNLRRTRDDLLAQDPAFLAAMQVQREELEAQIDARQRLIQELVTLAQIGERAVRNADGSAVRAGARGPAVRGGFLEPGVGPLSREEIEAAIAGVEDFEERYRQIIADLPQPDLSTPWHDALEQAAKTIEAGLDDLAVAFIEGWAAVAAGSDPGDAVRVVLGTLADLAIRVGQIAVGAGLAVAGIRRALESLNPVAAITAGAALIALGAVVKARLAAAADGGGGARSGGGSAAAAGAGGPSGVAAGYGGGYRAGAARPVVHTTVNTAPPVVELHLGPEGVWTASMAGQRLYVRTRGGDRA